MAKKTFETPIKVTISTADLQQQFFWNLEFDDRHDKLFDVFRKNYDWDSILNSAKFNKYVCNFLKNCSYINEEEICEHFFCDNEVEFKKIEKVYLKFVAENKKKESTIKAEYQLSITCPKDQLNSILDKIADVNNGISIDLL